MLGYYYFGSESNQEGYLTVYLLNSQKNGSDYPEFLESNVNSTFSVYAIVENHKDASVNAQLQVKVIKDMNPTFPVDINPVEVFNGTILKGERWEEVVTISLNDPGNYLVAFELWTSKENAEIFEFSNNFCVLNVEVV